MSKVYKPVEDVLEELNIPQVLSDSLKAHIKKYGSGCCRIGYNAGGVVNLHYSPVEESALQSIITDEGMVFICKCADEMMMTVTVKGEGLKHAEAAAAAREEKKVKAEYTKPSPTPVKEEKTKKISKAATVATVAAGALAVGAAGFFLWNKFSK